MVMWLSGRVLLGVCAYRRICIREVYGRGDGKWSWWLAVYWLKVLLTCFFSSECRSFGLCLIRCVDVLSGGLIGFAV